MYGFFLFYTCAALESFTPVWDQLFPAEQARIIQLLVEAVTYAANTGDVEITFRAGGVRTLARDEGTVRP